MVTLHHADARRIPEPDASVHCVVTSPPYWGGLRDYGVAPTTWGGAPMCEHDFAPAGKKRRHAHGATSQLLTGSRSVAAAQSNEGSRGETCTRCGAWSGCLGWEPHPDLYVQHMVEVFRELRRVLRDDGTVWLNVADAYVTDGHGSRDPARWPKQSRNDHMPAGARAADIPGKNLALVPDRLRIALQLDGWYVRQKIVWHKLAPLPGPWEDRFVSAHEDVILLAKSDRYFFDWYAVRERSVSEHGSGNGFKREKRLLTLEADGSPRGNDAPWEPTGLRRGRDVWTLGPEQCGEAHFAIMHSEIARRAVLAGTSEYGCCAECGAPWARRFEKKTSRKVADYAGKNLSADPQAAHRRMLGNVRAARATGADHDNPFVTPKPIGWAPTCRCGTTAVVRARLLDPFCGSGTVPMVAESLARDGIGCDANESYLTTIAAKRTAQMGLRLAGESA